MSTGNDDTTPAPRAFHEAADEALAALPEAERPSDPGFLDDASLGAGLRLALSDPERARALLALLEAGEAATGPATRSDTQPAAGGVPATSALLARSAALPASEHAVRGPEVTFGWAAQLTADEIVAVGRAVGAMLAAGAPRDLGRGFGLAWDGGVRLPHRDIETSFRDFTELEITVGGVLAGRDLRLGAGSPPPPSGLGALFGSWIPRKDPREAQAAEAVDRHGEDGRRGLVALWNAWMAMRFRALIPEPVFEQLVEPWVSVVGPLPDA